MITQINKFAFTHDYYYLCNYNYNCLSLTNCFKETKYFAVVFNSLFKNNGDSLIRALYNDHVIG